MNVYISVLNPSQIFEITVSPVRINTYISILLFFNDPFLKLFFTPFGSYHSLQALIVFSYSSLMSVVNTIFQFYDCTDLFPFRIDHSKRFRDFTNLHILYHLCHILWNQATNCCISKREVLLCGLASNPWLLRVSYLEKIHVAASSKVNLFLDIICNRIQTCQRSINIFLVYLRTQQNMAIVYTVTSLSINWAMW